VRTAIASRRRHYSTSLRLRCLPAPIGLVHLFLAHSHSRHVANGWTGSGNDVSRRLYYLRLRSFTSHIYLAKAVADKDGATSFYGRYRAERLPISGCLHRKYL